MKKYLQKKLNNEKGMTLIELLAVIVIIAIIAAIAIPAIGNIIENSRVGAIKSDASNVLSAVNLYETDGNNPGTDGTITVTELADAGYLEDTGEIAGATILNVANGTINGTTTVDSLTVAFANADNGTVNSMPNNQTGTYTPATDEGIGTITVTRN